jgi:hypothetical protein
MLQRESHTTEQVSNSNGATRRRSIDAILARREARLRQRKQQYAPDFMHGRATLDVGYDELGETWMENAVFVEIVRDENGVAQAWTVGWFQDRFLTIEQCVRDESESFEDELRQRLASRRTVVRLELDGARRAEKAGEIAIETSMERFLDLERDVLGVVRDTETARDRDVSARREDVMADSETTMMSLVCLCAVMTG